MNEPGAAILDEGVLEELRTSVDGDRSFVVELIETYLAEGETHLGAIAEAVAARDADALVRPAHTLKSSSATLGAMRISSIARELEMRGRTGTVEDAAADLLAQIREQWPATTAELRAWAAREGAG